MEFSLRVVDMALFVFCKFEIVIVKIELVMTDNLHFTFLYIMSIYETFQFMNVTV